MRFLVTVTFQVSIVQVSPNEGITTMLQFWNQCSRRSLNSFKTVSVKNIGLCIAHDALRYFASDSQKFALEKSCTGLKIYNNGFV